MAVEQAGRVSRSVSDDVGSSKMRIASRRRDRARDGDDLALRPSSSSPSGAPGSRLDAEPASSRRGLPVHPPPVDQAEAADRLPAEEDVLRDAQVGLEMQLLVHRR